MSTTRLVEPDALIDAINDTLRPTGVEATIHLVDRQQLGLRALPRSGHPRPPPLPIDASTGGRCFTSLGPVTEPGDPHRLWMPMIDGSERLGVVEFALPAQLSASDTAVREAAGLLTDTFAYLIVAKANYGDTMRNARRSRRMTTQGELLWRALPPLTFATVDLSLAAALEPAYEVGGDAFDYAADNGMVRMGIFDAIGHGLAASLTSTLTLAATRAARAAGEDLTAMAAAADQALDSQFDDGRYTTAVLAEVAEATGLLRYLNAGHPPPVVIRAGRLIAELDAAPRAPLGMPGPSQTSVHELRPGDRVLFYTDGVTEARDAEGRFFGRDRLLRLIERFTTGRPTAEALRRLSLAVLDHQNGVLQDDATLMLVEWRPVHPGDRWPHGRSPASTHEPPGHPTRAGA